MSSGVALAAETIESIHDDDNSTSQEGSLLVISREDNDNQENTSDENNDPAMRLRKRFRLPQTKEQSRDDHDTVPMLRREGDVSLSSMDENGEAVKKLYESIIMDETASVEICVSDSASLSLSFSPLNSHSLSSVSDVPPPNESKDESESRIKSVSFAEPMVTCSWDIPKIEAEDIDKLFYSSLDYKKFKIQRDGHDPTKIRDKEYVDRLVQNLDRMGAEAFARHEYQKALEAFKHSLRIKTETFEEYDNVRSTSATIHCIADVYSKMLKWNKALDTYTAALELLDRIETPRDEDARKWGVVLLHKISTIQGYLDVVQAPSRESI